MKKSNALMLSYMVFLSMALVAQISFSWSGLDRISMAATIAGCFFAFADFANWCGSRYIPKLEAVQKSLDEFPKYVQAYSTRDKARMQEAQMMIDLATPYIEKCEALSKIVENNVAQITTLEENFRKYQQIEKETMETGNQTLDFVRARIQKYGVLEMLLMIGGFISFFAIIVFDWAVVLLYDYQAHATTLAFIIIMLTYYLRDLLDDKVKKEVEDILKEGEQRRETARNMISESKETPALNNLAKLLAQIREQENVTEAQ